MKKIDVLYLVNSFINKPGDIGFRLGKLLEEDDNIGHVSVFSRGAISKKPHVLYYSMGIFSHAARLLNGVKIKFFPKFKTRKYDIYFFELCFFFLKRKIIEQFKYSTFKVAHLVETSPYIIKTLQDNNFKVIVDIPIAPTCYLDVFDLNDKVQKEVYEQYYDVRLKDKELLSYKICDAVNVPSCFVKDLLVLNGVDESKINVIPFGVDIKHQDSIFHDDVDYSLDKNEKETIKFVFAGQVSHRKGIKYLLDAWNNPIFKNHELHLCGKLRPEISNIIKDLGLSNIFTPGFVDTFNYLKNCNVYVFPSFWEGSSKSIYEAMASGLPVICTEESGSIIDNGKEGLIIKAFDSDELTEAMFYFINNPNKINEFSKKGLNKVKNYTWENYQKETISTYRGN